MSEMTQDKMTYRQNLPITVPQTNSLSIKSLMDNFIIDKCLMNSDKNVLLSKILSPTVNQYQQVLSGH